MRNEETELWRKYIKRFGKNLAIPFGHWRSYSWSADDSIREYKLALDTGIPFEPGTKRWEELFGEQKTLPDEVII